MQRDKNRIGTNNNNNKEMHGTSTGDKIDYNLLSGNNRPRNTNKKKDKNVTTPHDDDDSSVVSMVASRSSKVSRTLERVDDILADIAARKKSAQPKAYCYYIYG